MGSLRTAAVFVVSAGVSMAAAAKVFSCKGADGRPVVQDTPCKVAEPPPAPPPPLPCALEGDARSRAIRAENQFLTRFPQEGAHRAAERADVQTIVLRLRGTEARLAELMKQLRPILAEFEFYRQKPAPPELVAKAVGIGGQFDALADAFRNLEQQIATVAARYQCERATFGKAWQGAAPGASACDRPACAPP